MPARDGTGPLSQGSHTGHGMGNCLSTKGDITQPVIAKQNMPFHWGGRVWDFTVGRLFFRRHGGMGIKRN